MGERSRRRVCVTTCAADRRLGTIFENRNTNAHIMIELAHGLAHTSVVMVGRRVVIRSSWEFCRFVALTRAGTKIRNVFYSVAA